ncbi:hypothetical protein ACFWGP_05580 [Agromyces sp. NPDC127015]|uniref:hypothetical protein n=1 Tax=Agromyces sp. NPDC127015 TaxID=3347108 RepID=UPI003657A30E
MSESDDQLAIFLATVNPAKVAAEQFPAIDAVLPESFAAPHHRAMLTVHEAERRKWLAEMASRNRAPGYGRWNDLQVQAALERKHAERDRRRDEHAPRRVHPPIPEQQALAIAMRAIEKKETNGT